jgi:hypothetical protein
MTYGFTTPLSTILFRQKEFSQTRFGDGADMYGITAHIRQELIEIENAPDDLEERVDLFILSMELLWKSGRSMIDILSVIDYKQTKNESRKWPNKSDIHPGEPINHIK